jgi:hypothetical protein
MNNKYLHEVFERASGNELTKIELRTICAAGWQKFTHGEMANGPIIINYIQSKRTKVYIFRKSI